MIFVLLLIPSMLARMSNEGKECLQRGYELDTGYNLHWRGYEDIPDDPLSLFCLFPDRNYCLNSEFNEGSCGVEYKTEDYCIKQGDYVWDEDKCCSGLKPHLVAIGHPTCQPFSVRFTENLKYNPIYWFGIIVFLVLIGYVVYRIRKKRI